MFLDVADGRSETQEGGYSSLNKAEAAWIEKILSELREIDRGLFGKTSIITFYKAQKEWLEDIISKTFGTKHGIRIETVDSFQGQENEIIIASTVRTDHIGFARDKQRVNVAISRAKSFLIILGNYRCLSADATWRGIIESCSYCRVTYEDMKSRFEQVLMSRVPKQKESGLELTEQQESNKTNNAPQYSSVRHHPRSSPDTLQLKNAHTTPGSGPVSQQMSAIGKRPQPPVATEILEKDCARS